MSEKSGGPYLLRRVVARAGIGIWRHRGGVLVAALVAGGLSGYVALSGTGLSQVPGMSTSFAAAPAGGNGDCADAAMAAVADKSPTAAQRAYQCMDGSFQQRVSE